MESEHKSVMITVLGLALMLGAVLFSVGDCQQATYEVRIKAKLECMKLERPADECRLVLDGLR